VASLAQSIAQVILAPVIHHTEDIMHIHVLQDTLQKIRHPHYHMHPDFATGYTYGQSYYATHERPYAFTLIEVITVLRDNLARHDHEDLSAFSQVMGWEVIDYAYRVGFVLGWLTAIIEHGNAPVSPKIIQVV
jgi:hypothetical protein